MDAKLIAHRVVSNSCAPIEHSALEPKHDCAVASTSQSQLHDFWKLAAARHGSEPGSDFPVRSAVKWFDCAKGFGFVEISDGSGDAFIHVSVLARVGIKAVQSGEILEVRVGLGHRGPYVTEVFGVDSTTAIPATRRRATA
jgi:cold shock CspA family protein